VKKFDLFLRDLIFMLMGRRPVPLPSTQGLGPSASPSIGISEEDRERLYL
jgi:hypothetical protein